MAASGAARNRPRDQTDTTAETHAKGDRRRGRYNRKGGFVGFVSFVRRGEADPEPPARADGLDPDAGAYLDRLRLHGPATYGTMATALGWGAMRAWRAEAKLRAGGLVVYREGKCHAYSEKRRTVQPKG